ncbi:MAG: TRAP transporter small permease [Deltaproteobacteria bacterium]|nr:TRAP transporter small permease [Deltaproteobacteria bacterium]
MSPGVQSGETPRVFALIHRAEDVFLALLLGSIVLLAPLQIVLRNFFDAGWIWADPLLRVLVLWVALFGALAASRQDKQIAVDVVSKFLSPRARAVVGVLTGLFTSFVCCVVAYHSWLFVAGEREFGSKAFGATPAWLCEIVIPFVFAMIAVRHTGHAFTHVRVALGLEPPPETAATQEQT